MIAGDYSSLNSNEFGEFNWSLFTLFDNALEAFVCSWSHINIICFIEGSGTLGAPLLVHFHLDQPTIFSKEQLK